ncbi:protein transport protein Sec24-like [Forsythia ovata]|uniref:Protein transport protein Sec24-like n=1 Tax=Forsythia ovata TaxID=205694 RepID=A0ABD1SMK9_9LAMI
MASPGGPRPGNLPPSYIPNSLANNMQNLQINQPNQPQSNNPTGGVSRLPNTTPFGQQPPPIGAPKLVFPKEASTSSLEDNNSEMLLEQIQNVDKGVVNQLFWTLLETTRKISYNGYPKRLNILEKDYLPELVDGNEDAKCEVLNSELNIMLEDLCDEVRVRSVKMEEIDAEQEDIDECVELDAQIEAHKRRVKELEKMYKNI